MSDAILRLLGFVEELPLDWQPFADQRMSDDSDRATELILRQSAGIAAWRKRAGLPKRPHPTDVAAWKRLLEVKAFYAGFRRRRRA